MKKSLLLFSLSCALFAQSQTDVSLTYGYNDFDDTEIFKDHRNFYGIRVGIYQDNCFGFQLGYERAENVINCNNCEGKYSRYTAKGTCKGSNCNVDASRIYANTLYHLNTNSALTPYGLVTLGYEMLDDDDYNPSQVFAGAGIGARYAFTNSFGIFAETKFLQKFDHSETDILATFGLSYMFGNEAATTQIMHETTSIIVPTITPQKTEVILEKNNYESVQYPSYEENEAIVLDESVSFIEDSVIIIAESDVYEEADPIVIDMSKEHYYIQLVALSSSSTDPYLRKLQRRGFHNIEVKEVSRDRKTLAIVVAGPYMSRYEASQDLPSLRRVSPDAFIKKF